MGKKCLHDLEGYCEVCSDSVVKQLQKENERLKKYLNAEIANRKVMRAAEGEE